MTQRIRPTLRGADGGFSALEALVVVVIICVVAAVGIPALHSRAKASVLDSNLRSLAGIVHEGVLQGYLGEYRASGEGDEDRYLSLYLEKTLRSAGRSGYTNPVGGTVEGRDVLNTREVPRDMTPPAVLITDAAEYQYRTYSTSTEAVQQHLAGTLIVAFDSAVGMVDVYFLDESGRESSDVIHVPLG